MSLIVLKQISASQQKRIKNVKLANVKKNESLIIYTDVCTYSTQ